MGEQLEAQVTEYLATILGGLQQGGEWLAGELPLFVRELLLFKTAEHAWWFGLGVAVVLGCGWIIRRAARAEGRWFEPGDGEPKFFMALLGTIGLIPGIAMALNNIVPLFKVTLAPRLYLMEWLLDRLS